MITLDGFVLSGLLWWAIYGVCRWTSTASFYELDWGEHKGVFQAQYLLYRSIFLIPLIGGIGGGFAALYFKLGFIATLLFCAGVYAFLFLALLAYYYERYLAARWKFGGGHSNYSAHRYSSTVAFGFSAIILFLFGMLGAFLTCAQ